MSVSGAMDICKERERERVGSASSWHLSVESGLTLGLLSERLNRNKLPAGTE